MSDRRRHRLALAAVAASTMALAVVQHPSADLKILTHDIGDTAPRRFQAAVDLGVVAVSFLYTWTAPRLR